MPRTASNARRRRVMRLGALAAANPSIAALVMQIAAQYGLNPSLILAQATQESGLNPNAVNPKSGAQGVMQLMPATAAQFGVSNPFDPVQNITAGCKYMAQLLSEFNGDIASALAAYDWGPGNVTKAQAQYGASWLYYAPAETQNYVMAIAGIAPVPPQVTTIDATTGEVVTDDSGDDATSIAPETASLIPGLNMTTNQALLVGGILLGLYLGIQFLEDYL
jgi:hypothetical protein